jgi:CheY-like chemotaxis protein
MNGRVEASSPPGEGCCFTVELPSETPVVVPSEVTCTQANPRRVLYIEDEPLNVVLMQEIFRARPEWVLEVARDGASGVAQAQAACPDLALVDMNLPDFPGTEVLRQLRADPRTRGLRCIALSADAMADQIQAARDAGFADYWTKPIDLGRLLDAVAKALEQGHAGT